MTLTEQEIEEFLGQANVAIVATVGADGQPHAVPTWYEWADGEMVFHTGVRTRKYRNIRHNDRVSICVDSKTVPYKAVVVYGRATTEVGTDDERTRRLAIRYLGEALGTRYADSLRGTRLVIVRVRPDRIISWDYGRGDNP